MRKHDEQRIAQQRKRASCRETLLLMLFRNRIVSEIPLAPWGLAYPDCRCLIPRARGEVVHVGAASAVSPADTPATQRVPAERALVARA